MPRKAWIWTVGSLLFAILGFVYFVSKPFFDELRDKEINSDIGAFLIGGVSVEPYSRYRTQSGYEIYVVPAKSSKQEKRESPDYHLQILALKTLCSSGRICLWDNEKIIDSDCSKLSDVLRDSNVINEVRSYLASNCRSA